MADIYDIANLENDQAFAESGSSDEMSDEERELLQALKAEEEQSVAFWQSEIQENQRQALEQYFGQLYGDEEPGRSQIVTREIFETIEWVRPDLLDIFAASDRVVTLEPESKEAERHAEIAQAYINHLFFQKQDGVGILDQFAFDGLLQKIGVAAVYVEEEEKSGPERYEGMNAAQLQAVSSSPYIEEVVEVLEEDVDPSEFYPDGKSYDAAVVCKPKKRLRFDNIAPEDFRIASRSVSLDDAPYKGRVHRMSRSEAIKRFPHRKDVLENIPQTDDVADWDQRREARFLDEEDYDDLKSRHSEESQEVHVYEEYFWHDLDGDGVAEFYQVYRIADFVLEYEQVDDHPFSDWCPIHVPHRFYGLSLYDITTDLQRANTVLMRAVLDTTYQSVAPRMAVNEGKVNLNDLLDVSAGALIRTTAPPGEALMPIKSPSGAADTLPVIEHLDQVGEARTGVTRNAQGLDPDSLNKTATGIQLMQDAAHSRKRMIARNFGRGVQKLLQKAYNLLVTEVDAQEMLRFKGDWQPVNPADWSDQMRVVVDVGLGTGAREAAVQNLQIILQMQKEWASTFGMNTPVVTPQHIHNAAEEVVRAMGYRSPQRFFGNVEGFEPPEPPEPVEVQVAQIEQQGKQAEYQMKAQLEQMKAQMDAQKLENEKQVELAKIQQEAEMDRLKLQEEMAFKREQAAAELQLKERIAMAEMELKSELRSKEQAEDTGLDTNVRTGGAPG